MTTKGRCQCGAVQFEISGPLEPIQICYCSDCRRAQGTALATNMPVNESAIRFIGSTDTIKEYQATPDKVRAFCANCGSPLYSKTDKVPGVLRIRAGILDTPLASDLLCHFFVADKANWWPIPDDSLPRYDDYPPNR